MKSLNQLKQEVGEWSKANFGEQETEHLKCLIETSQVDVRVCLGSLAPLMGLVEELGELQRSETKEDIEDAIGDIGVYSCDYAYREQIIIPYLGALESSFSEPISYLGGLFHVTLKRHQGIRGYDSDEKYKAERDIYFWHFLESVNVCCNGRLVEFTNKTWDSIVSKRDWKENPNDGTSA